MGGPGICNLGRVKFGEAGRSREYGRIGLLVPGLLTIVAALLAAFISIFSIGQIVSSSAEVNEKLIPIVLASEHLQMDVVQVQQYLSDISATRAQDGLDDGIAKAEEAAAHFDEHSALLRESARALGQAGLVASVEKVRNAFPAYLALGRAMARAYIAEGTAAGNRLMPEFDRVALDLTEGLREIDSDTILLIQRQGEKMADTRSWAKGMDIAALAIVVVTALAGMAVTWRIASEMKRRERELDALQHRYQLILDSAGEGIMGFDRKGRTSFVNRTAATMLGYQPEDLIGRCFHLLVQPYDAEGEIRPSDDSPIRHAYAGGKAGHVHDDLFWRSDESSFHVEYLVAPIMEGDKVAGAVVVFRDVTLRLRYEEMVANQHREMERLVAERTAELSREIDVRARTEAALRASRERLKGITDSLFEGVLVVNRAGEIVFANRSTQRLLDVPAASGDLEGHPLDDLFKLRGASSDLSFAESPWHSVTAEGVTVRDDDAFFVTATGKMLTVAYACSPLRDDEGRQAALISFRDIGALKQAQREALQSSRLASVGQLAAGIAHEINTPIQYIGDNVRFIGDSVASLAPLVAAARDLAGRGAQHPDLAEPVSRYEEADATADADYLLEELPTAIRQSLDGVAQVARIVLSMKEFSHPGGTSKAMSDLNRALDSTLTVSRNTWKHVARVECDFAPDLPPVLCHVGELNQVFLNLIVNAAHAIESSGKPLPGRINLSTAVDGGDVVIKVADSGTGVPEANKERIFDPFFTTKGVGKGTGQGLAICRDVVVTKHHGRLDVGGKEGEGAVFTIRLPIDGGESVDDGEKEPGGE